MVIGTHNSRRPGSWHVHGALAGFGAWTRGLAASDSKPPSLNEMVRWRAALNRYAGVAGYKPLPPMGPVDMQFVNTFAAWVMWNYERLIALAPDDTKNAIRASRDSDRVMMEGTGIDDYVLAKMDQEHLVGMEQLADKLGLPKGGALVRTTPFYKKPLVIVGGLSLLGLGAYLLLRKR